MNSNPWILKLLSGTHCGAEMELAQRRYTLGSAMSSDIVIHDTTLPAECLIIDCENEVFIETVSSGCNLYCNGSKLEAGVHKVKVREFAVYTCGALHFCFGRTGAVWPQLNIPTIRQHSQTQSSSVQSGKARSTSLTPKIGRAAINILSGFFLFGCSLIFNIHHLDADTSEGTDSKMVRKTDVETLQALIREQLGIEAVTIEPAAGAYRQQVYLLTGYVATQQEEQELIAYFDNNSIRYKANVRVMEKLKKNVQSIIEQAGSQHIRVDSGTTPGHLKITGSVDTALQWEKIKAQIQVDVPGLLGIEDCVMGPEARLKLVEGWLKTKRLDQQVALTRYQDKILVKSRLDLEQSAPWSAVVAQYKEMFGDSTDLVLVAHRNPELGIRGISYGKTPYLIMVDGTKYTQGARLKNGYIIQDIGRDTVALTRGRETLEYRVGE